MRLLRFISLCALVALFAVLGFVSTVLTVLAAAMGSPIGFLFLLSAAAFYTTALSIDSAI